ncbi:MAG: zeta toxin family protein [Bacteroidetes bacterium]|nr:zeta toxin family protein [Fibrella sp.]
MDDLIGPGELEDAKKHLLDDLFSGLTDSVSRSPVCILLGGQPAAGKTRLIAKLVEANKERTYITINGDEFRTYHPRYVALSEHHGAEAPRLTQPFSNALVEFAKQECLQRRHDMIIEGTMRTFGVIERTVAELRQHNYRVDRHGVAIPAQDSLLGIFRRYEGELQLTGFGRFSAIAIHDEAYRQIPHNVQAAHAQQLFDRIVLYRRDKSGKLRVGFTIDRDDESEMPPDTIDMFEQARQPIQPNSFYHQQWLEIAQLARQRGETNADYLGQIDGFIRQFAA